MNHEQLRDKCREAMGAKVPIAAQERWSLFNKEKRTEFKFRYEWIVNRNFYSWVYENIHCLEIMDGAEWFGVYIVDKDGMSLNEY